MSQQDREATFWAPPLVVRGCAKNPSPAPFEVRFKVNTTDRFAKGQRWVTPLGVFVIDHKEEISRGIDDYVGVLFPFTGSWEGNCFTRGVLSERCVHGAEPGAYVVHGSPAHVAGPFKTAGDAIIWAESQLPDTEARGIVHVDPLVSV